MSNLRPLYIGIAAIIGAGKTTLAEALAKETGAELYLEEPEKNVYLSDFYAAVTACYANPDDLLAREHMHRIACAMESYLLNQRFLQQQRIAFSGKPAVQDRTIYEDGVFVGMLLKEGLMDERDAKTYYQLAETMTSNMCRPHMIVFLDVSPETALERIRQRGRLSEAGIAIEYMRALHAAYKLFIDEVSKYIPVIHVPWDEFKDVKQVAKAIRATYSHAKGVHNIEF